LKRGSAGGEIQNQRNRIRGGYQSAEYTQRRQPEVGGGKTDTHPKKREDRGGRAGKKREKRRVGGKGDCFTYNIQKSTIDHFLPGF